MKKISLPILIIGIWLIVSPWILGFFQYNLAAWNAIIIGVILIIFSLVPVRRKKK